MPLVENFPQAALDTNIMNMILSELMKNVNGATFGAGVVFGVAVSIAAAVVCSYVLRYWKQVLLLSAVVTALSLLLLAI